MLVWVFVYTYTLIYGPFILIPIGLGILLYGWRQKRLKKWGLIMLLSGLGLAIVALLLASFGRL